MPFLRGAGFRYLFGSVALLLLAGAGGWYAWRKMNAPTPPEITLEGDDPELAEAIERARSKVKKSPYSAEAWGQLGMLLRGVRLHQPARVCFAQAARLEPEEVRWHYLYGEAFLPGNPESALPPLRRAAALWDRGKPAHVAPWLRLAEVLLARGDYDEAERFLRRSIELDPTNASIHLQFGLLALARDDFEEARRRLLRCQYSAYTRQRACSQLSAVCRRLDDPSAAERFAASVATLPPDNNWIDPFVADCLLLAVGKTEKLRRVERLEARGDEQSLQEAIRLLNEVIEQAPDYEVQTGLARNLMRLGKLEAAEQALRAAVRLDADKVEAHYLLSKLAWERAKQAERQGDREQLQARLRETIQHAEDALARKSDHALAQLLRGTALEKLQRKAPP
jgi:cytochrome c-type biogenesis protein CcmH/NrfG